MEGEFVGALRSDEGDLMPAPNVLQQLSEAIATIIDTAPPSSRSPAARATTSRAGAAEATLARRGSPTSSRCGQLAGGLGENYEVHAPPPRRGDDGVGRECARARGDRGAHPAGVRGARLRRVRARDDADNDAEDDDERSVRRLARDRG
jgi:hypothetical protein